jgi:hypothetical protein
MKVSILLIVAALLIIALLIQFSVQKPARSIAVKKEVSAPNYGVETFRPDFDLPIGGGASPELDKPRVPYTLLNDALQPVLLGEKPVADLDAQRCYEMDYSAHNELTGNFSKFTNNNLPTYPDNCTTPHQELTGTFYTTRSAQA